MTWHFDNSYFRDLERFYAPWEPERPSSPSLLIWNAPLALRLGLEPSDHEFGDLTNELSGAALPAGADPIALAYAGHQFGQFSPQLGDGRALLLGEQIAPDGERFDIQLKGSGRTPFSRNGDGKYALAPALREHLVSEAMAALGVPTSRSLAVTLTGERIQRSKSQPGAVLTRVAKSHIRVGTFQFFATHLGAEFVKRLADYAIARHYPEAAHARNPYLAFFEAVMDAQIRLVAAWIQVGFVHGVMNTDNVAISGDTIDFGPCAFIDAYSSKTVFSSIDQHGRYAFGNQPNMCRWNLLQLGSALAEIIGAIDPDDVDQQNRILDSFAERYQAVWLDGLCAKLGFRSVQREDLELANRLFATMEGQGVDYTGFFRSLAFVVDSDSGPIAEQFADEAPITAWIKDWQKRLEADPMPVAARVAAMNAVNPLYIPRNHKVEEALEAATQGDMQPYRRLLEVVTHPFDERSDWEAYVRPAPESNGRYVTFCGT